MGFMALSLPQSRIAFHVSMMAALFHLPMNFGGRFCMNAVTPSA
jgi:hypothetical protein